QLELQHGENSRLFTNPFVPESGPLCALSGDHKASGKRAGVWFQWFDVRLSGCYSAGSKCNIAPGLGHAITPSDSIHIKLPSCKQNGLHAGFLQPATNISDTQENPIMPKNDTDHYDLVIVGAGAIGSAAAYHAARSGHRVLLLEQFDVGHTRGS